MDVEEFTADLTTRNRERMKETVDQYYNEEYFGSLGDPEDVIANEFPYRGWREFFFGCLPANRQISLITEQGDPWHRDRDLVVGLFKQIRDEVKHARIYTNLAARFGAETDLATWTPDTYDELVAQGNASMNWDAPHHISAAFQCGTEIQAAFMTENLADYLQDYYPDVARSLRDIVADEGDHVHAGRLTMHRFASPDEFGRLEEISQTKYEAALASLVAHTEQ
ncbi:hypothetical protein [Haloferax sp. DFSO52]|uniref:hypothetical protein n=1 Tax=Haloferax sp. DFSO52 TaxID=3388505 RepID=UPI003A859FD4